MAYYAKVEDDIVTQVIVAEQDHIDTLEGTWVQTSKNDSFKKQYAGIGFTYDISKDKFIVPQPFPSWSLDENDDWKAPVAYPEVEEGSKTSYYWNEESSIWVERE